MGDPFTRSPHFLLPIRGKSMSRDLLPYFALFLILLSTLELLVGTRMRRMMIALAILFLGQFLLLINSWSLGLSAVELVAGWMAMAILMASQPAVETDRQFINRQGTIFRIVAAVVIWLLVFLIAPSVSLLSTLPIEVTWSALILIGMGLLHLGMTTRPVKVIIGLFTILAGFEVFYAAVENSVLVAGLLAMITIGLAAVGAYLITLPFLEASE
jgi:hypothetical protein